MRVHEVLGCPMSDRPSPNTVSAWIALVRAHQFAMSTVESALKEANLPPLQWYDALLELELVESPGLRLIELEERLLLPQYGVSRLAARLEANGLIERKKSPEDKRGQVATITRKGIDVRRMMWPVYSRAIQRAIGAGLTDKQAESLAVLLNKIDKRK